MSKIGWGVPKNIGIALALILITFSALSHFPALGASWPVVLNPGFESPGPGPQVFPDHWVFTSTTDPPPDFLWLYPTGFPYTGAESAGILVSIAEPGDHAEWSQSSITPVSGGVTYNLTSWVYMNTPSNLAVDIGVIWRDTGGGYLGESFSGQFFGPQAIWFPIIWISNSPVGTAQATIVLRATVLPGDIITGGDVFFDDVEFYPLGDSSPGDNSPGDHSSYFDPDADPWNEMLQINVSAVNDDLGNLNFTLQASGTGDDSTDIAQVDLVRDLNGNGIYDNDTEPLLASGNYAQDDGTLQLNTSHSISKGQSHVFLIAYQLAFTSDAGETFAFTVTQIRAVGNSSGLFINLPGPPYQSAVKTTEGSLKIDIGTNTPGDHNWTPDGITPNVLLQLAFYSYAEDFTISNITVDILGSGDPSTDVSQIQVIHDIDGDAEIEAGETLLATGPGHSTQVLEFDPTLNVAKWTTVHLLIALVIAATATNTTTYSVRVTAIGAQGAVDASTNMFGLPITSAVKTVITRPPTFFDPFQFLLLLALVIVIILIIIIVVVYRRRRGE